MKYSFAIGIPTINRYDLLQEALKSYRKWCPDITIYIIDNGNQGIPDQENIHISVPGKNIGVAASWNRLCDSIYNNHDYAVIPNDDIIWSQPQDMIEGYLSTPANQDMHFISTSKNLCLFAMRKNVYTLVGSFDEHFYPAYFEDNDYLYRMKLKGIKRYINPLFEPTVYRNSMSIKRDFLLNKNFKDNQEYYIKKWGGLPGQEKYTIPFNKSTDTK